MKVALIVLVSLSVASAVSVSTLVADEWKLFKVNFNYQLILNYFTNKLCTESAPEGLQ